MKCVECKNGTADECYQLWLKNMKKQCDDIESLIYVLSQLKELQKLHERVFTEPDYRESTDIQFEEGYLFRNNVTEVNKPLESYR